MADLKKDLDNYLSRNDNKSQLKITMPALLSKPDVGKWFTVSASNEDTSATWLSEAQKDCCPSLSRIQRITGFCLCILLGLLCFVLAAMYTPVLLLKARKFALLYTMGSLFTICSFSFLWGPLNHLQHLFSRDRLPFTAAYFGTLFATLYFALQVQSTPLTVLCAVGQIVALLWFLVSYIPGGQTGLQFCTRMFSSAVTSTVSKTLPV
ncbi:protein transport protein SFT2 [Zootermopsis nevadensis]|uniref:Vesicle transport protein n=1 Tax=Zootermopsis nevadensis TaxID=136037 RepID=A0A067RPM5_ZOONE|nr:protein transport protein SFT2 [Zootermopsis nevadensis]KDR21649.1 Protein transport protein SFT2 [Zootermopsis nevadensis]